MSREQEYTVGFYFNRKGSQVALIKKINPEWQRGNLNGIGGKVEEGESPLQAMIREFEEEAGLATDPKAWREFAYLSGNGWTVYFFAVFGDIYLLKSQTPEEVQIVDVVDLPLINNIIPNLRWLVPMALEGMDYYTIREVPNR